MPCPPLDRAYPDPTVLAQINQPMPYNLSDYSARVKEAVSDYWDVRHAQAAKSRGQGVFDTGVRAEVTGGRHLDALQELVVGVFVDAGIPAGLLDVKKRPIAGYFRRDKSWDIVVMVADLVVGIIELNMLIEDNEAFTVPVKVRTPVWEPDPAFDRASYADRYVIFFERMVRERLLDAACLVLADKESGAVRFPSESLSFQAFAAAIHGRCLQFMATNPDIDWSSGRRV